MELQQLKYFQIAAKTQNFSKAAEEMNISQPSLSMTISRLEDEIGAKLFDRKGRNIVLNKSGEAFLMRISSIFLELDNAKSEVSKISGLQSKRIKLATTNPELLSVVLKDFLMENKDVIITQKCDIRENIQKQLQSGEIDLCLAVPTITGDNIKCQILKEDRIVLIVPESHRFANRKSINLSEVSNDPFIALDPSYNFRKITDDICRIAGFTPNVEFEVGGSLVKDMLELGRGVALLPKYLIERPHEGSRHLKMLEITFPDSKIQIGLSWQKQKYMSDSAMKILNFFVENYSNS